MAGAQQREEGEMKQPLRGNFQRKPPHSRFQLNTRIETALADRFYASLQYQAPRMTTAQAVAEAIELWLAHRDAQQLEHISIQEIETHAQPE